jgi:hypothetical protein
MPATAAAVCPAGFADVPLTGVVIDIAFDGEPAGIRHRFDESELICQPLGIARYAFRTTYTAAVLDHGELVVHFVKTPPYQPEIVTLVLDADGCSALAVSHHVSSRSSRRSMAIVRGSVGGAISFATLISFPLRVPLTTELRLTYAGDPGGADAVFTRAGHLRAWRTRDAFSPTRPLQAVGRLLAIAPGTAVLPWIAGERSGTLVLDRRHATFWGVNVTPESLQGEPIATVSGHIDTWTEATS